MSDTTDTHKNMLDLETRLAKTEARQDSLFFEQKQIREHIKEISDNIGELKKVFLESKTPEWKTWASIAGVLVVVVVGIGNLVLTPIERRLTTTENGLHELNTTAVQNERYIPIIEQNQDNINQRADVILDANVRISVLEKELALVRELNRTNKEALAADIQENRNWIRAMSVREFERVQNGENN